MRTSHFIYTLVFALMISTPMRGQQTKVIVGYGETFETIASKHGITIKELQAANPGKNVCYTGMEIIIPQPNTSPIGDRKISSIVTLRADSMLLKAKELSSSGNYRNAIKLYNRVLGMKVRTPYAYAGLGECYFGLNKYKEARKNLNIAINSRELAPIEKEWCKEALEDVENEIEAKRQRRKEAWSKLGLSFAYATAVAATTYAASEQAKMQNQYYQNTMPSGYGSGSSHESRVNQIIAQSNAGINQMMSRGTAQLNMMTQNTMIQAVQTKQRIIEATTEEFKYRGKYEKEHGYPPTEMEVIQWYQANYPDLVDNYIQALGKRYEDSYPEEKENKEEYKGELSPEQYRNQYKRYEDSVKGWYNNLTIGGVKYKDKDGDIRGITDSDMKGNIYVGNQMGLYKAKQEMRRIRLEAEKYGVHIEQSKWETATSHY